MAAEIEIEIEIAQRETIKPSSATPDHLRILQLSMLDKLSISIYIPLILFYPNPNNQPNIIHLLKNSLSKTLTLFYPLAGRIKQNDVVECNDAGAEFFETRVNCPISKILERSDPEILKKLLPIDVESEESMSGNLLLVQANFFDCGGIAIGVSISHKIADASTLSLFINTWSSMAIGSVNRVKTPEFSSASLFPPMDLELPNRVNPHKESVKQNCLTRRYVFESSKIAILKSKLASSSVENPTRVEAVSALIWKCLLEVSRSKSGAPIKPSLFCVDVNIRRRTSPPLPDSFAGNLVGFFSANHHESSTEISDHEIVVQDLVVKLRKGIEEANEKYQRGLDSEKEWENLKVHRDMKEVEKYSCSSWLWFEWYGADFGWGLPFWVSLCAFAVKNVIVLLDARDGQGIEAWVTLTADDAALMESNEELRKFASLNPRVV